MVDFFANSPTICLFSIDHSSSGMGVQNSSNIDTIKEYRENETLIDVISSMSMHGYVEDGER